MKACTRCGDLIEDDDIAKRTGGKCKPCKAEMEKNARDRRKERENARPFRGDKLIKKAAVPGAECRLCTHEQTCNALLELDLPILCENIWVRDIYWIRSKPSPTPHEALEIAGLAEFVIEKGVMQC